MKHCEYKPADECCQGTACRTSTTGSPSALFAFILIILATLGVSALIYFGYLLVG